MFQTVDIPWLALAKSLPFWALTAATIGNDFGLYTLLMQLPTYLRDVLGFNLEQVWLFLTRLVFMFFADWFIILMRFWLLDIVDV